MRKVAILLLLVCSCGASWKDTVRHSNGVYENLKTGECWIVLGNDFIPVHCPGKEKINDRNP